ncbi:MAG TPA: hypothetical protein VHR38_10480 [Solirubrobacterales bacterium]|jgi:hypothetical protein|nr:hypothetical protein [Solirubrobacterales bacterium]
MSADPRLYPDRLGKVPRTGAIGSVQAAELDVREPVSRVMSGAFLEWAAEEYWRVITRFTLGLVRVVSAADDQCVVLVGRPLVLLRFHAPEYETGDDHASVTWRIRRGILVSPEGRDSGFLRLSLDPLEPPRDDPLERPVRVQMEVRNFYPWLRGAGVFARVGVWIYAQTQQRIHRAVTRRFLRRLAAAAARQPGRRVPG